MLALLMSAVELCVLKLMLLQRKIIKAALAIFLSEFNVFFIVRCFEVLLGGVRGVNARV